MVWPARVIRNENYGDIQIFTVSDTQINTRSEVLERDVWKTSFLSILFQAPKGELFFFLTSEIRSITSLSVFPWLTGGFNLQDSGWNSLYSPWKILRKPKIPVDRFSSIFCESPLVVCAEKRPSGIVKMNLGGGFNYVLFSSIPGEMAQFDGSHIFQMGWWTNHQLGILSTKKMMLGKIHLQWMFFFWNLRLKDEGFRKIFSVIHSAHLNLFWGLIKVNVCFKCFNLQFLWSVLDILKPILDQFLTQEIAVPMWPKPKAPQLGALFNVCLSPVATRLQHRSSESIWRVVPTFYVLSLECLFYDQSTYSESYWCYILLIEDMLWCAWLV